MRTAIFYGFVVLGEAVRPDFSDGWGWVIALFGVPMILADVSDFFRERRK